MTGTQRSEAVKKSAIPVILSAAKNLQLFVFKKINADASLRSARQPIFSQLLLHGAQRGIPYCLQGDDRFEG
jgi:hypothetical protein